MVGVGLSVVHKTMRPLGLMLVPTDGAGGRGQYIDARAGEGIRWTTKDKRDYALVCRRRDPLVC